MLLREKAERREKRSTLYVLTCSHVYGYTRALSSFLSLSLSLARARERERDAEEEARVPPFLSKERRMPIIGNG